MIGTSMPPTKPTVPVSDFIAASAPTRKEPVCSSKMIDCTFGAGGPNGGSGAPDTHLFRIENGKLRYVHTLTHLLQSSFKPTAP